MQYFVNIAILIISIGFFQSCQNGNGSTDASIDDRGDPTDEDGTSAENNIPILNPFILIIPESVQACSIDWIDPNNLQAAFTNKSRLSFFSGQFSLPTDQEQFRLDLIEKVELGSAQTQATSQGPGKITRIFSGSEQEGLFRYVYTQEFLTNNKILGLNIGIRFPFQNRTPLQPSVTFDEHSLSEADFNFWADYENSRLFFSSCSYNAYKCSVYELEIAGGDLLKIETCSHCPSKWTCPQDWAAIRRLQFNSGSQQREVNDPFRLAHSVRAHNNGADFLAFFEESVGPIRGLYFSSESYQHPLTFVQIHYLNTPLKTIETRLVLSCELKTAW